MDNVDSANPALKELGVILSIDDHVRAPAPTDEVEEQEKELLQAVRERKEFGATEEERRESEAFCTRSTLRRYLRARKYNMKQAVEGLADSLRWRHKYKPHMINPADVEHEAVTGKNRTSLRKDKWGRPIILFDSSVENTTSHEGQMSLLKMNLEHAVSLQTDGVEKNVVFCHLANFSIFKSPSLATSKKTFQILSNHYPERLGHAVLYRAPTTFSWLLAAMRPFVDPVTYSKVVCINGDVSKGSKNDKILTELLGAEWREMTGAESPRLKPDSAPGYDHAASWAVVQSQYAQRVAAAQALHGDASADPVAAAASASASADTTASASADATASASAAAVAPPEPPAANPDPQVQTEVATSDKVLSTEPLLATSEEVRM